MTLNERKVGDGINPGTYFFERQSKRGRRKRKRAWDSIFLSG